MPKKDYHQSVASYYDEDVNLGFEQRADENPLLEKIRADFRQICSSYASNETLEIGCGPGFDLVWYASEFPGSRVTGIDISPEMIRLANQRISDAGLTNAEAVCMDERKLSTDFLEEDFGLVFVFFGALNTVSDLSSTASDILRLLKPGGHAVLTFVNKWYLREMIVQLIKGRVRGAFARVRSIWGGYSPDRYLPSKCYSPGQVKKAFNGMRLINSKGYSIFYPAWYNFRKMAGKDKRLQKLWRLDQRLQHTFLWSRGEYTLFVFEKK